MKLLFFALASCAAAQASLPTIQVALAPGASPLPRVSSVLSHLDARRAEVEGAGLKQLDAAYDAALSAAKAEIDAIVGRGSFLSARNPHVFVKVASAPGVDASAIRRIETVEGLRSASESTRISQAAAEFSALSKVVLQELRRALHHGSFLSAGLDDLNVSVKASKIPFPTPVDLLNSSEFARDSAEASFDDAVLAKQLQFVKALNAMIAAALSR